MLTFAPIASQIPAAVLAGILITVGINVMDYKGLKAIYFLPKDIGFKFFNFKIKFSSEVLVMVIVLLLSTFWDLIYAVSIGLVMASLIFMKKIGSLTAKRSEAKPFKETIWMDTLKLPEKLKQNLYIRNINGPLFFGSTEDFQTLSAQIPASAKIVIIRLGKMVYMDQSGLYAMEDMLLDLKRRNVNVLFVRLLRQPRYMMERIKVIPNVVAEDCIFEHVAECVEWLKANLENKSKL
jgi:SulP family sulfate permease